MEVNAQSPSHLNCDFAYVSLRYRRENVKRQHKKNIAETVFVLQYVSLSFTAMCPFVVHYTSTLLTLISHRQVWYEQILNWRLTIITYKHKNEGMNNSWGLSDRFWQWDTLSPYYSCGIGSCACSWRCPGTGNRRSISPPETFHTIIAFLPLRNISLSVMILLCHRAKKK